MPRQRRIGALAAAAQVPTSTVRYYERRGLLRPAGRTEANYRVYDEHALERLRFIRAAQAIGFTLDDIARLLAFRDGETVACEAVRSMIQERLATVAERMADLHRVEAVLAASLQLCHETPDGTACRVLRALNAAAHER